MAKISNNYNYKNSVTDVSLLIFQFNTNGLKNHIQELETVLINSRIDITLITETHFTECSNIYISGYKLNKTNHTGGSAHSDVAILTKSSIKFQPLPSFCQINIHSCKIILKLNYSTYTIAAIYTTPEI